MKKAFKIGCFSLLGLCVLLIIIAIFVPKDDLTETHEQLKRKNAALKSELGTPDRVAPPPAPPPKSEFEKLYDKSVHRVHVTELVKDYRDNEFAADEKYKGQVILVRGNITHFDETFGIASIQLETGEMLMSLSCRMQKSEKPKLAQLKKGQDVLVVGTLEGLSGGFFLGMKDCLVMPSPED